MNVIVTGGSGKAGRAAVAELLEHGHNVTVVDQIAPGERKTNVLLADLTDFGQTVAAFEGTDAIVHLAAIPAPGIKPNAETFRNNAVSDYNVFEAARLLGIKNVVWASSETVLGLPFDVDPPYVPLDEEYKPRPESAYSLAKLVTETMAEQFCRWNPELKIFGLRFSNVMEPHDYAAFPGYDADAETRRWNLWCYIDARDAAQAVRLALESPLKGAEVFIVANDDTVMSRSSQELMAERFPNVPIRREVGTNEALMSSEKAKRLLGFQPRHNWRDSAAPAP
ncbi:NAD(P)-dependent oxidoreductase [bacterium]|nr:MAG: NAD(P)-dependent oxidoreductase [bacterium]